ncbi:MAG: hypothetical protein SNJ84_00715 [Verrucomicrobiia bacterium]
MSNLRIFPTFLAFLASLVATFPPSPTHAQPAPNAFMGMGLDGFNYFSSTPFANTFFTARIWTEFGGSLADTQLLVWDNPQFDPATLLPRYLNSGRFLRAQIFPSNANYFNRPSSWPRRSNVALGRVLVTWTGDADIRLTAGSLVSTESNGPATGSIVNGRRMYQIAGPTASLNVEIRAVNPANPPTSLHVWLPDPNNPTSATLEGQLWHPLFIQRLRDMPLRFLRFMDWGATNASPQLSWSDRRLPSHSSQIGVLNPRAPASGFSGQRPTGAAYEYMVQLANEVGTDLWVCVPHLADDTYIRKLARLIRFGSDGLEPYSAPQAHPVFPPLRSDLKVWVEFSNEIWSGGSSFPQGEWAQQQANALGLTRARFNARQFCRVWRIFQEEFGGTSRLVRVAALFTANSTYNQQFLSEIATFGSTLSPAVTADVASPTTYFGNGIQDWVHQKAQTQANSTDPWFYTGETFTVGSTTRPVTIPMTSDYWTSTDLQRHHAQTFTEWKRRLFSGATLQGGGPDATGIGGGFDSGLPALVQTALGRSVPLVAYEGGPSIYTDYLDSGDSRDDGITAFMESLNRSPGFAELLRIQYNMALSKGLRHNGIFVGPSSFWGKFGQWGQLEAMDQNPAHSPRWQTLIALNNDFATLRPVDQPLNAVPSFLTGPNLAGGQAGVALTRTISTTGGDGTRSVALIGANLLPGLTATISGSSVTISGTPTVGGENFLYLRVADADGDASWRIFRLYVGGGPGVLFESNFEGTNPSQNLPWTAAYQIAPGWITSGWTRGSGITPASGDNALFWSQNMPSPEINSTLADALGKNAFWTITLSPASTSSPALDLRGAILRFSVNRIGFHAPRRFAVFTNLSGLALGDEVFVSDRISMTNTTIQFEVVLPATSAFNALTGPITFRLVGFAGEHIGHVVRLMDFQLLQNPDTISGPSQPPVLLESNFTGTNPAKNLPWTLTHQIAPNWTTSGWTRGSGITPENGDNALVWRQNMPATEELSTLADALGKNAFWQIQLAPGSSAAPLDLRGATLQFTVTRLDYHAPRRFAVFCNLSGFALGNQIYTSPRITSRNTPVTFTCYLPISSDYHAVSGPVSFRIVGFSGQYNHPASLSEFRITQRGSWLTYWRTLHNLPDSGPGLLNADPDQDGWTNLAEYALGGNPTIHDATAIQPKIGMHDGLLGLTFRQFPDPNLVYHVQYSEDLIHWQDIWVSTGASNQDNLVTVTELEPPSNSPRKFLRLRIEKP